NIYDESGKPAVQFERGKIYMVELLMEPGKEVPYAVIDVPLAAGFEVLRQDIRTTRELKEFNRNYDKAYSHPWVKPEYWAERVVFYTYSLERESRLVYFIKALYSGEFTWLSTVVRGMYHPQYFGRTGTVKVKID
ncbi:MAG: hypothetical protein GY940_37280, partial [bacterium]|nr:hypothetical protein [bacterium]